PAMVQKRQQELLQTTAAETPRSIKEDIKTKITQTAEKGPHNVYRNIRMDEEQ
ncbi:hypothetical protein FBU30_009117, partial [Linnemannia zychae]